MKIVSGKYVIFKDDRIIPLRYERYLDLKYSGVLWRITDEYKRYINKFNLKLRNIEW